MTLFGYFARRFLIAFLATFAAFLAILAMVDMVEQIRRLDSDTAGFLTVLQLTLLNVPQALYRILPLLAIFATLGLLLNLARSSELVATRASGRSALRSLVPVASVAFAIGVAAVAVLNPIVAATSTRYEILSNRLSPDTTSVLSIGQEGLWLRQGGPEGQTVIHAARSDLGGTLLFGATFISFGPDGAPIARIEAETASLADGAWEIAGAKEWRFGVTDNPERDAILRDTSEIPSDLTEDQIRDSFGMPSSIPIWELPAFIERLELAGFSARSHRVWLLMEIALPLSMVAMVLAGAGVSMRHTRLGRARLMAMLALGLGFAIHFLRNFAQILGDNGQISPALAAFGVPVAAILLSLGIVLNLEDG